MIKKSNQIEGTEINMGMNKEMYSDHDDDVRNMLKRFNATKLVAFFSWKSRIIRLRRKTSDGKWHSDVENVNFCKQK